MLKAIKITSFFSLFKCFISIESIIVGGGAILLALRQIPWSLGRLESDLGQCKKKTV